jgi:hypothetical protein
MSKFDCYQKLFKKYFWSKKSMIFFHFFDALVAEATSGGNIAEHFLDSQL